MDNLFINSGSPLHDKRRRRYGFFNFMGDLIMVFLTGGLWLIWIFVREMRNN